MCERKEMFLHRVMEKERERRQIAKKLESDIQPIQAVRYM